MELNENAVKIALKIIKQREGCVLHAYPDPASDLYKQLSQHNLLNSFMQGKIEIPEHLLEGYSGEPWTAMYGETKGIKYGDTFTQEQADQQLEGHVREFMQGVLEACPALILESNEKIAACTSLAYNIGLKAFANSTVCKKAQEGDFKAAGDAFMMWDKARDGQGNLIVSNGLKTRRQIEKDLFLSAT